jgi:hypothetical protein
MIRVVPAPESPQFDVSVRKPGAAFLATCSQPTSQQFKKKAYWSRVGRDLHAAYSGICAYTAMYLPDQGSVDHFIPKTVQPALAYEWSNFRLANGRVNSSKGNNINVLDPFSVQDDWFHMDIPACLIKPNPMISQATKTAVRNTLNVLRLNQDDNFVQERCNILIEFAQEEIGLGFLKRRYPFLAKEVDRQHLDQAMLRSIFRL